MLGDCSATRNQPTPRVRSNIEPLGSYSMKRAIEERFMLAFSQIIASI